MSFFSDSYKITKHDFDKALFYLKEKHGFSHEQLSRIKDTFAGSINESGSSRGISREELKEGLNHLSQPTHEHRFDDRQISHIDEALSKYL